MNINYLINLFFVCIHFRINHRTHKVVGVQFGYTRMNGGNFYFIKVLRLKKRTLKTPLTIYKKLVVRTIYSTKVTAVMSSTKINKWGKVVEFPPDISVTSLRLKPMGDFKFD